MKNVLAKNIHRILTTFNWCSYNLATEASNRGYSKLRQKKIPFERPVDFYAEMLKSDSHMQKIKDRLIFQRQKLAAFESRKKAQHNKKYQKEVRE